jgi:hypothetical protein
MNEMAFEVVDLVQTGKVDRRPSRFGSLTGRLARPVQSMRALPHIGTWVGVLVAGAGFVLVAIAWGRTAGLANVALQIPYVVSAAFTGLGLVVVGVTVVSIAAKQEDARERRRQLGELRALLSELRSSVGEEGA